MKKFKKVMAMGLAAMAVVSAMSISAMAAEEVDVQNYNTVILNSGDSADESGVFSNGVQYTIHHMTPEEIAEVESKANTRSLTEYHDNVLVPLRTHDGDTGVRLGGRDFVPAPHSKVQVRTGKLPSMMQSVYVGARVTDTAGIYEVLTLGEYDVVTFTLPSDYLYEKFTVTASTSETPSYADW